MTHDPFDAGRLTAILRPQPSGPALVLFGTTASPKRRLAAVAFSDTAYAERLVAAINAAASTSDDRRGVEPSVSRSTPNER